MPFRSRLFEDGGSIYMKRAIQQSIELKQLLLRDLLQVESIWKSCFYVSMETFQLLKLFIISYFSLSVCIVPAIMFPSFTWVKISSIRKIMIFFLWPVKISLHQNLSILNILAKSCILVFEIVTPFSKSVFPYRMQKLF